MPVALEVRWLAAECTGGRGGGAVTGQPGGIGTWMRLEAQNGTPATEPINTSWSGEGGWRQAGGSGRPGNATRTISTCTGGRSMDTRCAEMAEVTDTGAMGKGGWQEFSRAESLQRPVEGGAAPAARAQRRVRVQRTKTGKGGKTVTVITGLELPEAEAKALLKALKARAGSGGTLKDGLIELQGDQVAAALALLELEGFRPKQAGG